MTTLYKNIRELREQKNISQEELAKLIGYTNRSSIAKIEKGEVDLSQSKIIAFAKALGTTPGKLMGLAECEESTPVTTIAAHFDGNEYTEEELDEIRLFAEFVKARRK